jgi:hypothetical protein
MPADEPLFAPSTKGNSSSYFIILLLCVGAVGGGLCGSRDRGTWGEGKEKKTQVKDKLMKYRGLPDYLADVVVWVRVGRDASVSPTIRQSEEKPQHMALFLSFFVSRTRPHRTCNCRHQQRTISSPQGRG